MSGDNKPANGSSASQATDASSAAFAMTDLEDVLRGPDGAARVDELLRRFAALHEEIKAEVAAGLPPDRFAAANAITTALAAAREIVRRFETLQGNAAPKG